MKKLTALIVALVLTLALLAGCGSSGKTTLVLLNWGEYLDPELIERFEDENPDIVVDQKYVTSNEEMYTICSTEGTEIDMLIPSEYLVQQMMAADLLAEVDLSQIPNFKYVEKAASSRSFDPDSKYSVPYMMGTVGIVYNTTLVDEPVDSWSILWDKKYEKSIMMYDSVRDSMMVALSMLGYDINSTNPQELAEAADLLLEQKPLVYAYLTDEIKTSMMGGSVALAVDYSGAAADAIAHNPDLDYVVPKEGSNVWVDNMVILKSSEKKEAAHRFINFLCQPDVAAQNSQYIGYYTPNDEAMKLMPQEYLDNPAYLITEDQLSRCEYYVDLGADLELMYDEWMRVKTTN